MTDIFNIAIRDFLRTSIGFSKAFEAFEYGPFRDELGQSFPHYNIRGIDHKTNVIELAVAGFDKSELDVVDEGGILTISGGSFLEPARVTKHSWDENGKEKIEHNVKSHNENIEKTKKFIKKNDQSKEDYVHKGVAKRKFTRQFQLSPGTVVEKAEYKNGMLSITVVDKTKYQEEKKIPIK